MNRAYGKFSKRMARLKHGLLGVSLLALAAGPALADQPVAAPSLNIQQQGSLYGQGPGQFFLDYSKAQVSANGAFGANLTGAGQVVAVLDSGIDRSNPELINTAFPGYNALAGGTVASDVNGHGTFVSGLIDSAGIGMEGIAYHAFTYPVQIMNSSGTMVASDFQLALGTAFPFVSGVRIFNNSWNSTTPITAVNTTTINTLYPYSLLTWEAAVQYGSVFVFAAGNQGSSQPGAFAALPYLFPQLQPGWLAVVATDSTGAIASFSNRCGVAAAYCLAAPGSNLISTLGTFYGVGSGTSFSTPIVSGAIALLKQEYPYLSAAQCAQILLATATKTGIYANQAIYGQGLLNIAAAVNPVGNVVIPGSNTVAGNSVNISASTAIGSAAFAQSWAAGVGPIMVLDSFGRPYNVNASAFNSSPTHTFDALTATQQYGFGEMAELSPGVSGFYMDQYQAQPLARIALTSSNGGRVEASSGTNPAYGFGAFETGTVPAGALVSSDGVGNPYMDLADDATTAHVATPIALGLGDTRLSASLFSGSARTADLTARLTDPSYTPPTVSGGAVELAAPIPAIDSRVAFNFGGVSENGRLLGGSTSGAFGETQNTRTMFAGVSAEAKLGGGLTMIGGFQFGESDATQSSSALNVRYGALSSTSFHMGVVADEIFGAKDKVGFVVSQPLRVSGGNVSLDVPTARDFAGNVYSTPETVGAKDNGHETDLQAFYAVGQTKASSFDVGVMVRMQPDNVSNAPSETIGLMRWSTKF